MTTKTLLILAAGLGSRYGGNKQIENITEDGEMMMDFAVYDAIKAGFNKIVFIIREDFADIFKQATQQRWANKAELFYVYQDTQSMLPEAYICRHSQAYEAMRHSRGNYLSKENHTAIKAPPFSSPAHFEDASLLQLRQKPWGTSHAILCAQAYLTEPFALINADDFYGRHAYEIAIQALDNMHHKEDAAAILYPIIHTLSENGNVNRGLCTIENNYLSSVREIFGLHRNNGSIVDKEGEKIADSQLVSMNFWILPPGITEHLQRDFLLFLQDLCALSKKSDDKKKTINSEEFLLPSCLNNYIQTKILRIRSCSTHSKWLGITYKKDLPKVRQQITELIQQGQYPRGL